jgi:hypothetical protein
MSREISRRLFSSAFPLVNLFLIPVVAIQILNPLKVGNGHPTTVA